MIPRPLAWAIILIVTVVWAGNAAAAVFVKGYTSDPWINFVFSGVVGSMLTLKQGDGVLARVAAAIRHTPTAPPPPPQYTQVQVPYPVPPPYAAPAPDPAAQPPVSDPTAPTPDPGSST